MEHYRIRLFTVSVIPYTIWSWHNICHCRELIFFNWFLLAFSFLYLLLLPLCAHSNPLCASPRVFSCLQVCLPFCFFLSNVLTVPSFSLLLTPSLHLYLIPVLMLPFSLFSLHSRLLIWVYVCFSLPPPSITHSCLPFTWLCRCLVGSVPSASFPPHPSNSLLIFFLLLKMSSVPSLSLC